MGCLRFSGDPSLVAATLTLNVWFISDPFIAIDVAIFLFTVIFSLINLFEVPSWQLNFFKLDYWLLCPEESFSLIDFLATFTATV